MKLHFGWIVLILFAVLGCSSKLKDQNGPARVQMLWPQNNGEYKLQAVELRTLSNLRSMSGSAATIRFYKGSRSPAPRARFSQRSDGVWIPEDFQTLQMATLYAHMEKLGELDEKLGIYDLLPRPRRVFLEFALYFENEKKEREAMTDNALFFAPEDSLIVVPFRREGLPLTFNAGVLAHEHFHSLFHHAVGVRFSEASSSEDVHRFFDWDQRDATLCEDRIKEIAAQAPESDRKTIRNNMNRIIVKALNEGLADFWGWLYTQDPQYVVHSLPKLAKTRTVRARIMKLPNEDILEALARHSDPATQSEASYCLGTYFSSLLRSLSENRNPDEVARKLIKRLPKLAAVFERTEKEELALPADALLEVVFDEVKPDKKDCAIVKNFSSELAISKVKERCQENEVEP